MVERVNEGVRLGEYMKQHIFDPLGMTLTGFRLVESKHIRDHLCETVQRTPAGKLTMSNPYNPLNPADDFGGGGLYSSVADYMKVLISLLKNDGLLLRPDTVKMMFEPQLYDPKALIAETQGSNSGAMFRGGIDCQTWNFGLGGILTTADVEWVCRRGTMSWSGLPNLVAPSCSLHMLCFLLYFIIEEKLTFISCCPSSGGLTQWPVIAECMPRRYFHLATRSRWHSQKTSDRRFMLVFKRVILAEHPI